jgi:hypothetical protein
MKSSRTVVLVAAAVVVVALVAFKLRAGKRAREPASLSVAEQPAPPPVTQPASAPPPSPPPPAPRKAPALPLLSEARIMERLHQLGSSDPEQSLALAREGNRRFKDSRDVPERSSIIVRSLSSLGRHDEARAEALKMERDYPTSAYTQDVHRHMFVNPGTHPAERGYGKKYELE